MASHARNSARKSDFRSTSQIKLEDTISSQRDKDLETATARYSSNRGEDHGSAPSNSKSYIPPFARADRWRPGSDDGRSAVAGSAEDGRYSFIKNSFESNKEESSSPPATRGRVMPKHFRKPLTCFYWATLGKCNKSESDCWYAHRWTGMVAEAPVKVGSGASLAGRNAETRLDELAARAEEVKAREESISVRERDAAFNEQAIDRSAANLKDSIRGVYTALESMSHAASAARSALEASRGELLIINTEDSLVDQGRSTDPHREVGRFVLSTVDGTLEAICELEARIMSIERHTVAHVGGFVVNQVDE